jgi:arylsulfatase A-like enzyme
MRRILKFCTLCVGLATAAAAAAEKPNIILVMADDQGWGDTGYNGHPVVKTPNLDAMAKEAYVFNHFYAAAPVCSPTRGSVLTGRHPFRIKITNHGRYMRPQETTIAEELKAAGYVTGMFGKWHVGSAQAESPVCPGNSGFDEWCIGLNFFDNDPYLSRNGKVEQIKGAGSAITIDETIAFLRKHKDGAKPMFSVAWFPSPHDPHQERPDPTNLYEGQKHAGYFGEISVLDTAFGRLRKELRTLGIADNTILWYCSDNGGLVEASSGGRARKGSIYEGGLRVPSILEWPKSITPGTSEFPACTSDILPTVLAMVGVERTGKTPLDGIDLTTAIAGKASKRPPIGFWHGFQGGQSTWSDRILKAIMETQHAGKPTAHPERLRKDIDEFPQLPEDGFAGHAALLDWPWKLHRIKKKKTVTYELYNLSTHPMENKNLAASPEYRERLETMQAQLGEWQLSVMRSLNGKDYKK